MDFIEKIDWFSVWLMYVQNHCLLKMTTFHRIQINIKKNYEEFYDLFRALDLLGYKLVYK